MTIGGQKNGVRIVALAFASIGFMSAACAVEGPAPVDQPEQVAVKPNPTGSGETAEKKIDNQTGGTVALTDGTAIEVPAGALPPGVDTITVTSSPTPAPTDYKTVSPMYVFGPEGTVFLKPLKISIPFTSTSSPDKLTVLWSRQRSDGFDMVPTAITAVVGKSSSFVATGEVTHFSSGMVGEKYLEDPRPAPDPYAD